MIYPKATAHSTRPRYSGRPNYASELQHQSEENARYADGTVDSERTSANWSWDSDAELWLIHGVSFPLHGTRSPVAGKGKLTPLLRKWPQKHPRNALETLKR